MTSTQTGNVPLGSRWRSRGSTLVSYHFEEELPDENRIIISVDLLRELTSIAPGIFGKSTLGGHGPGQKKVKQPPASKETGIRTVTPEPGQRTARLHGYGQTTEQRQRPKAKHGTESGQDHRLRSTPEYGNRHASDHGGRAGPRDSGRNAPKCGWQVPEMKQDCDPDVGSDDVAESCRQSVRRTRQGSADGENATKPGHVPAEDQHISASGHIIAGDKRVGSWKPGDRKALPNKPFLQNIIQAYRSTYGNRSDHKPKINAYKLRKHRGEASKARNESLVQKRRALSGYDRPVGAQPPVQNEFIGLIGAEVIRQPVSRSLLLPKVTGNTCVLHDKEQTYEAWQSPRTKLKPRSKTAFVKRPVSPCPDLIRQDGLNARSSEREGKMLADQRMSKRKHPVIDKAKSALARLQQRKSSTPGLDPEGSCTARNTDPTPSMLGRDGLLPSGSASPIQYVMTWLNGTTETLSDTNTSNSEG